MQIVVGDPGVGKTRLAAALAEHAADRGAHVIWTRGWGRAAPAYWPWVEVVRGLSAELDGALLRRELGSSADHLLRLAPELAERLPDARTVALHDEDSEIARFALFDALVALLRLRGAAGPVVVLVDDLQAVDEGSLVALDFVSRTLRDAPVLLVATMHERVPARAEDARLALQNVARVGRRLVVGGLTCDGVARLIELVSGSPAAPGLAQAVHAVTEGNPLFAREILALLLAEGRLHEPPGDLPLPDGVRETIRRRLEPLDGDARETLELAAVIGRRFALATLERASALHRDRVLAGLDAAIALGLVLGIPDTIGEYRFGHGLIRETLLSDMSTVTRVECHRVVGEALEHVYRGAIDEHLPELAHHFLEAAPGGDVGKAADYAQRGGDRALATLAYEQAAELYGRALGAIERMEPDLPRRAGLLLSLGTAQSRAGRPAARATFEAAISAARAIDADDVFARAALGYAPFALAPGYVDDTHVALLVEALERIGPDAAPMRVRLLAALAVALYWSDSAPRRAELAADALAMARELGDDATLAIALSSAQLATCGPDATEQGRGWLGELFAIAERTGETAMTLAARSRQVDVLLELDELAGADIAVETLERLAREARDRRAAAFVPFHRARRAALAGRLADARQLCEEAVPIVEALPASTLPLTAAAMRVVLIWLQRGPREIGELVRAYADGAPAMPCWRAGLAAALAASGRCDEARHELDRLVADDCAALPRDNLWFGAIALLTEAVAALGLADEAGRVHAQLVPFAGRNAVLPSVAYLGPVDMWLGILARVAGRGAEASERLAAARVQATRDGARPILARIAVEEAALLVTEGGEPGRRRALELLEEAIRASEDMDLADLQERARALVERLRAAPERAVPPVDPPGEAALRRVGDVWTVEWRGRTIHVNDGRGVRLLALLLERPGAEVHSLDLVAAIDGAPASGPLPGGSGGQEAAGRHGVQGGAGPVLDATAKDEYRARIEELEAELADSVARRDRAEAARTRSELEFLRRELARATGLHGRDRESGSHAERARVNVTRAIRSTIKRIASYDAELGEQLDTCVRTGTFCAYLPDPQGPLHWTVRR